MDRLAEQETTKIGDEKGKMRNPDARRGFGGDVDQERRSKTRRYGDGDGDGTETETEISTEAVL